MHTSPAFEPATGAASVRTGSAPQRRVVDAPTRMFHGLFALSFLGAYLTAEGEQWRALHVTLGYAMAGLLAFRVLYGLFGPRHARLTLLLRRLTAAPAWLRAAALRLKPGVAIGPQGTQATHWRQGQNLLAALNVLALLALVVPLTLSGYGSYSEWGNFWGGDWLEEVHEFFANATLLVVLGHIATVVGLSLLRRRNQVLPMLTGRIDGVGPDLVAHNHAWLAGLLLICVLTFFGWQWQQFPHGLLPAQGWAQIGSDRHPDDDD
jgi:cytochrome b